MMETPRPVHPLPRDMPLAVWDGQLTQGADAVVIVPTIWEWDGATAIAEGARWERSLRPAMVVKMPTIQNLIEHPDSRPRPVFDDILSFEISDDGTRPIGSPRRQSPAVAMRIPVIVLTFGTGADLANRTFEEPVYRELDGTGSTTYVRLPLGVLPIRLVDPEGLGGEYILCLHVRLAGLTR